MKYLKTAGLCLVSMLMMSMALAATASAAPGKPVWEGCLKSAPGTKYLELDCEVASGSGEWGWAEIANTDHVVSTAFTISLTDTKTTVGESTVVCTKGGRNSGTVGPGKYDRVELARVEKASENCRATKGGCKETGVEEVAGVNLPWQTEVFETEKKFLTKLTTVNGTGEPGWRVKCDSLLGSREDTCTTEPGKEESLVLENKTTVNARGFTELLVYATFEKAHLSKCSEGGAESGKILGTSAILLANASNEVTEQGLRLH